MFATAGLAANHHEGAALLQPFDVSQEQVRCQDVVVQRGSSVIEDHRSGSLQPGLSPPWVSYSKPERFSSSSIPCWLMQPVSMPSMTTAR